MSRKNPHPVPAVIAVVVSNRRVLLVRRKNPPDVGLWGFPGGKIFFGEPIVTAAERELREETHVIGKAEEVMTVLDAIHVGRGTRPSHYLLVVVRCRYVSGQVHAGDDASDAGWFSDDEVSQIADQLSRDVLQVARAAFSARTKGSRLRPPVLPRVHDA